MARSTARSGIRSWCVEDLGSRCLLSGTPSGVAAAQAASALEFYRSDVTTLEFRPDASRSKLLLDYAGSSLLLTVWNRSSGTPTAQNFYKTYTFLSNVKLIHYVGTSGDDIFDNETSIAVNATGGGGNDKIYSLLSNDDCVLDGGPGNDTLISGSGHDTLIGGPGNDYLSGGSGQDTLNGGTENDTYQIPLGGTKNIADSGGVDMLDFSLLYLAPVNNNPPPGLKLNLAFKAAQWVTPSLQMTLNSGSSIEKVTGTRYADQIRGNDLDNVIDGKGGDDKIYGYGGRDQLIGDTGNDMLFGGVDVVADTLDGGAGYDRFLIPDARDTTPYLGILDVKVLFIAGGHNWTQTDVEAVDYGLGRLQAAASNNSRILKTASGGMLTFVRGAAAPDSISYSVNDGRGRITLYDKAFDGSLPPSYHVIHEIAHNWDNENYFAPPPADLQTQFKIISGWQHKGDTTHVQAYDFNPNNPWYHLVTAEFAREYGKKNFTEDIATSFEAYFFGNATTRSRLSPKIAAIRNFFSFFAVL